MVFYTQLHFEASASRENFRDTMFASVFADKREKPRCRNGDSKKIACTYANGGDYR